MNVVNHSVVPLLAVLLTVPAAMILTNLLAAIPNHLTTQVRPALVLRSE